MRHDRRQLDSDTTLAGDSEDGLLEPHTNEPRKLSDSAVKVGTFLSTRPYGIAQRSTSASSASTSNIFREDGRPGADPHGLQLVSDTATPKGTIVFIHGLGGSAYRSWSWKFDVTRFWPPWLSEGDDFVDWRILTFGYNSSWKGTKNNLNISDFAKDLLLQMLTYSSEESLSRAPIGSGKIILVAHSMGGLVAKKAYLLGKQDEQFSKLVANIHGIMFLGTPHRGSQYASMLHNIMSAAPLGPPPKAYIGELQVQSNVLQEINDQFRHQYGDLELVSYFETLKTSFGPSKLLVCFKFLLCGAVD